MLRPMRKFKWMPVLAAVAVVCGGCATSDPQQPEPESAQSAAVESTPSQGDVVRLDPALDELIAPGAKLERLAEGLLLLGRCRYLANEIGSTSRATGQLARRGSA